MSCFSLSTGDSYPALELLTRIADTTLAKMIPEVCNVIYKCLMPTYLKVLFESNICDRAWENQDKVADKTF